MSFPRIVLAVVAVAVSAACGPSVPPLASTHNSPTALAAAVLTALEQRDLAGLRALALDEREFRDHVWPDLPSARPERNLPFSFVWGDLHQKSDASLGRTLANHGGQRYTLVSVRFVGGTTPYKSYVVHRQTELTVKDAAGAERPLRVFGSVLAKGGRLKVFSYVVDD